jgi:hypothetical protein
MQRKNSMWIKGMNVWVEFCDKKEEIVEYKTAKFDSGEYWERCLNVLITVDSRNSDLEGTEFLDRNFERTAKSRVDCTWLKIIFLKLRLSKIDFFFQAKNVRKLIFPG